MALTIKSHNNYYLTLMDHITDYYDLPSNIKLIHPTPICIKKSNDPLIPCSYIHPEKSKGNCKFNAKPNTNRCGFHQNK